MTKPQITRIWLIGIVVMLVGLVMVGVSMGLMFTKGGTYEPAASGAGYDFIPRLDSYFWTTISFMIAGGGIAAIGAVGQLVAWVGAMVNTYRLPEKTWFAVLLGGGVVGLAFGLAQFAVMIAYIIAGPDSTAGQGLQFPPPASTEPTPRGRQQPTTWAPSQ